MQSTFPFTAIIGQESLKTALVLSAIDQHLGGLLICGPRGCGKSTAARSLADLLQSNHHFVNLPLGASEDRVIGTIDAQKILDKGEVKFSPGLLHKANQGMLYVDEVNLLPDHLIDILLDVSASGTNYVERDGLSHQHDAIFILVGTMNPDEGELRPQILDRFGLMVELSGPASIEERIQITTQRITFDNDPALFCSNHQTQQQTLSDKIARAKSTLSSVRLSETSTINIATLCHDAQVEGIRADITLTRAAIAYASFSGDSEVTEHHIDTVKNFVLCHRRQHTAPPSSAPSSAPSPSTSSTADTEPNQSPNNNSAAENQSTEKQGQWGELAPQSIESSAEVSFKTSTKHPSISALKKNSREPQN
ncbi:MAG: magnesium chelatase [Moraxellaceae bacterium]|nr:MAG: magnesium chelatase [Moraxellaceae bacterium]